MIHKISAIILVFNNKGELALQLRAEKDDSYLLHWDFSAAGGIESGEDYALAAKRELKEEIGVDTDVHFIGKEFFKGKRYAGEDYSSDLYIFKAKYNGDFSKQVEEVKDVRWFKLDKIQEMIDKGEKFHPEFIFVWNKGVLLKAN